LIAAPHRRRSRATAVGWLFLLLLLAGCLPQQKGYLRRFDGTVIDRPESDALVRGASPAVLTVEALDGRRRLLGFGTGFVVGPGTVATCLHVIESASLIQVRLPSGEIRNVSGVRGSDPLNDLVVLEFDDGPSSTLPLALRTSTPSIGESVTALAGHKHLRVHATRGKVLAVPEIGGGLLSKSIVLSVPVSPGFSGGPVLDAQGNVLGITSEILTQGSESVLRAVPASELEPLLRGPSTPVIRWLELHPQPTPAASILVSQAEALGFSNLPRSLSLIAEALRQSPSFTRAWTRRAALLLALQRPLEAEACLRKVEELRPGLTGIRLERSACLVLAGKHVEGRLLAEELARENPGKPILQSWLAVARLGARKREEAIEAGSRACKLGPDQAACHLTYGVLLANVGCLPKAQRHLERSTQIQGELGPAWMQLGLVQWRQGDTNSSRASLRRALECPNLRNPTSALYVLFLYDWGSGDSKAAMKAFGRFLEAARHPENAPGPDADPRFRGLLDRMRPKDWNSPQAHELLSKIMVHHKAGEVVWPILEACVWTAPDNAECWTRLAVAANAHGDHERATVAARRALGLQSGHSFAHWALGVGQYALGDAKAGRTSIMNATVLNNANRLAWEALVAIELKEGRHDEAKRIWEGTPSISKTDSDLKDLEDLIPDTRRLRSLAESLE
jgi:tetratricopeptide (TPR) repeat protein